MNILRAWKDSLSLFAPKNFKLFALVTFKTIWDGYKVMLRYWWWLYGLLIGIWIYDEHFLHESIARFSNGFEFFTRGIYLYGNALEAIAGILTGIIYFMMPFLIILSIRPSVKPKNYAYFLRYLPLLGYIYILNALFIMILKQAEVLIIGDVSVGLLACILLFIGRFPLPLITFFSFFLADSDKKILSSLKSLYRAFIMILYNYPLCWLVILLGAPVAYVINMMLDIPYLNTTIILLNEVLLVGTSIYLCIWSNIYIKKLHEQSKLYFKEPS